MKAFLAGTFLLFAVLTAVLTYPQVRGLRDAVHDDGDPLLNAWTLAWVAHQLPNAPAHLFDANIFYPERRTLAYSETLLVPALLAAPLRWVGVGPLLVYNLVFLSGFVVSGVGTALLVRHLTGHTGAAILAGIVFAFLPYRIDHYPHLQLQQTQFIPLALWAFHRLLESGRLRDGLLLGLFVAGQALSCMYYGLFLIPYMAVVCGALLAFAAARSESSAAHLKRCLVALAVGGALAAAAVFPVARAYVGARRVVGERGRGEVAIGSATWRNYLGAPDASALYGTALAPFAESERRLFPGFVAIALAVVALWPPLEPVRIAYLLGLLFAFDLSLGFNGVSFTMLYDHVLPFRALRIPARMGLMTGFSLAVLAGFGAARLARRLQSRSGARALVLAIGALMLVEYASKPLDLQVIPLDPPAAYGDILRDKGDSPTTTIFEFPISALDDPTYMYYSTFHWQHLVNGYSGFFPPSYVSLAGAMRDFPAGPAFDALREHGTRYVVIHGERLYGGRYAQIIDELSRRRDLALVSSTAAERQGQHGEIAVYRIKYE
jgi:hypothetical protein